MSANNKNILITGASGGIGKVLSNYFSLAGYNLALQYLNTEIDIKNIAKGAAGNQIIAFKADLQNELEVKSLVNAAKQQIGGIDILINNAGVVKRGMSWKLSLEDWKTSIDTNLTSIFLVTKYCIPYMRERAWGRIINIGSVVGSIGVTGVSAYAASKSALIGFTKSVAKEVADKNITVNNVALGYMEGGMVADIPNAARTNIIQEIPMKKFGPLHEVCPLLDYIISENASYLTGQTIGLNGGLN